MLRCSEKFWFTSKMSQQVFADDSGQTLVKSSVMNMTFAVGCNLERKMIIKNITSKDIFSESYPD